MFSLEAVIGVIQSVREALEAHRDDTGAGDLFMACAALEWAESVLFEVVDEAQEN